MTELAKTTENALPAHLQGGRKSSFGNVDASDLIIPRIKLLQSVSEEVTAYDNAKVGQFWHTLAEQPLGDKLRFVPLILQKSLVLWAPRGDDRGILARSSDNVNWDDGFANLKFEVKIKGQPKPVEYDTKANVAMSGLAEFGSSIPGDESSRPAASLTYRMMFLFPDFLDLSPAIVINTRSSIRPAKQLISKIEMRDVDHYYQMYEMSTTDEKGDEGPYKGYSYRSIGFVEDTDLAGKAKAMFEKFKALDWRANDEQAEEGTGSGGASSKSNVTAEELAAAKTKF